MEPLVLREDTDDVATLTLNRPDKLNAVNPVLFVALREHIDALSSQTDTVGCDIIVAGSSASFSDTQGRWGMAPVWGMSVRLPERVGRGAAKVLMFSGRRIDGREAERIGLADACVPDAELDEAVRVLAGEIVANSWGTSRIDKQLLAASARMPRTEALPHERTAPFGFPDDMAERMSAGR